MDSFYDIVHIVQPGCLLEYSQSAFIYVNCMYWAWGIMEKQEPPKWIPLRGHLSLITFLPKI